MAPRGKKNASSKRRNAAENEADIIATSPSSSSLATSSTTSTSTSRRGKAKTETAVTLRSTRRSTQNATNFTPKLEETDEPTLDMSEDSDFETPRDGGPAKSRGRHAKGATTATIATTADGSTTTTTPNTKKRSADENQYSSISRQKQKKLTKQDSDVDIKQVPIKEESIEPSISGSGSDGGSEFQLDEDQSSEDEEELEEVSVSDMIQEYERGEYEDEEEELSGPWQYNAVEIVFDKPLNEIKNHIAESVQVQYDNLTREVNALQVLALWWRDSFFVTGPGIRHQEYMDLDVVGPEAVFPTDSGEYIKQRKNLQRRLLNRNGSTDVCSQLFTATCRSLGLKARLIESLQACSFKISLTKEESTKNEAEASSSKPAPKKGKKKKEVELDESDTTRGSRVVLHTPHRLTKKPTNLPHNHKSADPPVFWTEVYSISSRKWIPIDPVRGYVNSPLKLHPSSNCLNNVLAYVVAYDEENYMTDVTRRYTSTWTTTTKKLRVQPAGNSGFDWWSQTMSGLSNPYRTAEEDLEEEELLKAEISERMPTKLGDFNNHPLYALERHIKKFEVLHPRIPVLGHIRGEAIYPRSCVKQVRSKENWLKRGRVIKSEEVKPIKWVKSHAATIFQMRLRQQIALSGERRVGSAKEAKHASKQRNISDEDGDYNDDDGDVYQSEAKGDAERADDEGVDKIPLFGEWQTEAYQPPWVVDGKVPRNQYGRQDVFTPEMVPIGGTHLKGRGIGKVARLLGVDYVEAVTGFEFQSRKSVPVIQGVIVPTEQAELVLDAYYEIEHQRDQEAHKKKRTEALKRWRKLIKGVLIRARLAEDYGEDINKEEEQDGWVPEDDEDDGEDEEKEKGAENRNGASASETSEFVGVGDQTLYQLPDQEAGDSGAGFMLD
ncbi:hypothetical protein BGX26_009625 [Mortierella sp. AD094]|nr:hypothetical protein BGX26_009625 [Mortierella sp. AD094]